MTATAPLTRTGWQGEEIILLRWEKQLHTLCFAGIILCMGSLVTSPALLAVGMVVVMLSGLLLFPFKQAWRRFWKHKPAVLFGSLFVLSVASGLWIRNDPKIIWAWLNEMIDKAPLLLGMYSLAVLGPFSTKQVRIAIGVLLLSCFVVGTGTVIDYILHTEEIEHNVQISKEVVVWLGCNHIYFSVVMAFAVLGGFWSAMQKEPLLFKGEKYILIFIALICFFEMHVLTTRTGLVGLYLTLLILGWFELFRRRRYFLAIMLAVWLCVAMPWLGYTFIGSFQHRIDNSVMDVTEYFKGNDPNYLSIGTRIESWKTSLNLWRSHPLIGVGMADLKADMTDQYVIDKTKLCPENFQQPHNQFLQNLAGWGLLGFFALAIAWFYPVVAKRWHKKTLFWAFWLNYSFAMMGESTMERQVGIAFLVIGFMLTLSIRKQSSVSLYTSVETGERSH